MTAAQLAEIRRMADQLPYGVTWSAGYPYPDYVDSVVCQEYTFGLHHYVDTVGNASVSLAWYQMVMAGAHCDLRKG